MGMWLALSQEASSSFLLLLDPFHSLEWRHRAWLEQEFLSCALLRCSTLETEDEPALAILWGKSLNSHPFLSEQSHSLDHGGKLPCGLSIHKRFALSFQQITFLQTHTPSASCLDSLHDLPAQGLHMYAFSIPPVTSWILFFLFSKTFFFFF